MILNQNILTFFCPLFNAQPKSKSTPSNYVVACSPSILSILSRSGYILPVHFINNTHFTLHSALSPLPPCHYSVISDLCSAQYAHFLPTVHSVALACMQLFSYHTARSLDGQTARLVTLSSDWPAVRHTRL